MHPPAVPGPRWILSDSPVGGLWKQSSKGTPGAPSNAFGPEKSADSGMTWTCIWPGIGVGRTPGGNGPEARRITGCNTGSIGGCAAGLGCTLPPTKNPVGIVIGVAGCPLTLTRSVAGPEAVLPIGTGGGTTGFAIRTLTSSM